MGALSQLSAPSGSSRPGGAPLSFENASNLGCLVGAATVSVIRKQFYLPGWQICSPGWQFYVSGWKSYVSECRLKWRESPVGKQKMRRQENTKQWKRTEINKDEQGLQLNPQQTPRRHHAPETASHERGPLGGGRRKAHSKESTRTPTRR